jgi:integrase
MTALSYMQRRTSGIYEFRRRLPREIAGKPAPAKARQLLSELINPETGRFKQELTVSLGTSDHQAAKRKDMRQAVRVADLFAKAVRVVRGEEEGAEVFSLPSPEEIEADTIRELLRADEEEREEGDARRHMQTAEERAQWPDLLPPGFGRKGMADGHLEVTGLEIAELAPDYRRALAKRDPAIVRHELSAFLKARSLPIAPDSAFYREAGLAVLRGHVKAYDLMQRRQEGDDVPTPVAAAKGPTIEEAFGSWRDGSAARGGRRLSPRTLSEAERAVRYFKQWHGNLRLGDISKEKAREFRNAVAQMPTRLTAKERAMPLKALLAQGIRGRKPVHAGSVNKYLNLLSAIVTAAEKEGTMDRTPAFANPFKGLALVIDKRSDEGRRKPFETRDLEAIFGTSVYQSGERPEGGAEEAAYWLPLVGLLSGARLNEIAQLRVKDLRQNPDSGIWFLDISTEGRRAIKTAGSRREVPVHPELKRLGLLRYRQSIAGQGEEATLWPGIKSADGFYRSTAWSKWFNRYLRLAAKVTDPRLVFHSFRHTFKRLARDAGLSEEVHDALTGHVGAGGVGRGYGNGFGLGALDQAVSRIDAPAPVKALPAWRAPARED